MSYSLGPMNPIAPCGSEGLPAETHFSPKQVVCCSDAKSPPPQVILVTSGSIKPFVKVEISSVVNIAVAVPPQLKGEPVPR